MDGFPSTKKLYRVPVPHPIFDYVRSTASVIFGTGHIRNTDIILVT
jgi:hypothetical protein